jgi:MOSC domain-containing protein YiiM
MTHAIPRLSSAFAGPEPAHKRRYLTKREKAEVCLRQNGKCGLCADRLRSGTIEYDHRIPLAAGGTNDLENFEALCTPCHRDKTKLDVRDIAKVRRLSGETGQQKRRSEKGSGLMNSKWKRTIGGKAVLREEQHNED